MIPYNLIFSEFVMFVGVFAIASAYFINGSKAPHQMPDLLFIALGIIVPFGQLISRIFILGESLWITPWISPLALGVLYLYGRSIHSEQGRSRNQILEQEIDEMNRAIRNDPRNASAYWRKAELYEAKEMYDQALANYNQAYGLGGYGASEFNTVRDRLQCLIRNEQMLKQSRQTMSRQAKWSGLLAKGWLISLVILLPVLFNSWRWFFTVYSIWLFAIWCAQSKIE